jgi:hypothetical protein
VLAKNMTKEFTNFLNEISKDFNSFSQADKPIWSLVKEGSNKGCYELKYVNEFNQQVDILYNPTSKKVNITRDWPSKTTFEVDFEKDTISLKIMESENKVSFDKTISPENVGDADPFLNVIRDYMKFSDIMFESIISDPNYANFENQTPPESLTPEARGEVDKIVKVLKMCLESSYTIDNIVTAAKKTIGEQLVR